MLLYLWSYRYPPALLWCTTSAALARHASTCTIIFFYLAQIDSRLKWLLPLFSLLESVSIWCKICFSPFPSVWFPGRRGPSSTSHLPVGCTLFLSSPSILPPRYLHYTVYDLLVKCYLRRDVWVHPSSINSLLAYAVVFEEKSICAFVLWYILSHRLA